MYVYLYANTEAFWKDVESKAGNTRNIKSKHVSQRTEAFHLPHNKDP